MCTMGRSSSLAASASPAATGPRYVVEESEARDALARLTELGLVREGRPLPFIALFIGGHGAKRWPASRWLELARALDRAGGRVVVFAGPEEAGIVPRFRQDAGGEVRVLSPMPLRSFAALWSQASLAISPDSGPMHLAAALGVPTIAVLKGEGSTFFAPRGQLDVALLEPTVEEVVRAATCHARWSGAERG